MRRSLPIKRPLIKTKPISQKIKPILLPHKHPFRERPINLTLIRLAPEYQKNATAIGTNRSKINENRSKIKELADSLGFKTDESGTITGQSGLTKYFKTKSSTSSYTETMTKEDGTTETKTTTMTDGEAKAEGGRRKLQLPLVRMPTVRQPEHQRWVMEL